VNGAIELGAITGPIVHHERVGVSETVRGRCRVETRWRGITVTHTDQDVEGMVEIVPLDIRAEAFDGRLDRSHR
jgi:hypothetical protein